VKAYWKGRITSLEDNDPMIVLFIVVSSQKPSPHFLDFNHSHLALLEAGTAQIHFKSLLND